jgi:RNA polymerase sigma factor (sigma-70 family)
MDRGRSSRRWLSTDRVGLIVGGSAAPRREHHHGGAKLMVNGSTGSTFAKHLHTLFGAGAMGALSDGQLLERFLSGRDLTAEAAFTALVERHGPMVLRVCRQMLVDPHDAQDAFQATFLVLVRRADSVEKRDSLASWLHGVARRVAVRVKADATRRRFHESHRAATTAGTSDDPYRPESWPELHEEISRLPQRYRDPVILCYLEGLTAEAAAQRLGCPRGTILSRLSRARRQLRGRLTRRGMALPATLLAAGLSPEAATASLLQRTVQASFAYAEQNSAGAALASARSIALARGAIYAMTLSKLKILGTFALASVLTLGGVQTLAQFGGSAGKPAGAEAEPGDRPAGLARAIERLQDQLDESTRRNAELQKQLQDLRAELRALRTARVDDDNQARALTKNAEVDTRPYQPGSAAAGRNQDFGKAFRRPGVMPSSLGTMPGPVLPATSGRMDPSVAGGRGGPVMPKGATAGGSAGSTDQLRYSRLGNFIIATSPRGNKIKIYSYETQETSSVQLTDSKEAPLEITPIVGPGAVALYIRGPKITQIAAADALNGTWQTQDLREPVEGEAMPIVGPGVIAYGLGRYVYAYSPQARRWDVLKLPAGVTAAPIVSPSTVTVEVGGHIFTFPAKSGTWHDLDLNAILKDDDDKPKASRPEK